MNKIQFNNLLKPLVEIYDSIELDLIKNIISRVDNYTEVSGSLKWYLEKLSDLGTIDKETLKILKSNKKLIKETLKNIMNNAGTHIEDLDKLNKYYEQGLININPNNLYKSNSINNLINEALKDSESIVDLINTKAIEATKDSYRNILNKAYIETSSGIYTYQESIRRALNEMAKEGITIANYESGKHFSIESVVRRDVITRTNKLVGDCELEHAKQLDTNLVYVDQHLGARVRTKYMKEDYEAHVEWQGKKYMIDGSSEKYHNLYEATGYGEMLGLKGINCYHNLRPTWTWEKVDERLDEEKNATEYAKLQKEREYERKIRRIKREKLVAKELDNKEDLKNANKMFKKVNQEYDDWLKENNLTRDYSREYVSTINKKIILESEENFQVAYSTQEIFDNVKNIVDEEFINRTKGVKVKRENNAFSYYDSENNIISLGKNANEYSLIHELGHRLQTNFTNIEQAEYKKILKAKFAKYSKNDFEKIIKNGNSYYLLKDFNNFVNQYQTRVYNHLFSFKFGKVNTEYALEYFSVSVEYYYKNRELLKEKDYNIFEFIERLLKK